MIAVFGFALLACIVPALGDISNENPPAGACLCLYYDGVNIRDGPCGDNVIGMGNSGSCYTYTGQKVGCTMSGTFYQYFEVEFGARMGWIAGDFMRIGSDSQCSGEVSDGYSCPIEHAGMRVHETTAPTEYDCVDGSCSNTCQGGQCVALVTCECKQNGMWPPGTQCWSPGTPLKQGDGTCNSNIPSGTAIATFDGSGAYYAGHAAIFVGCLDANTIQVWDQWCCSSIGYTNYVSSHSYFNTFAVITLTPGCSNRPSWACRYEAGGPTCCDTWVPGCEARKDYWQH